MAHQYFIENKIPQLIYYTEAYLQHRLSYDEVILFLWDILEEWSALSPLTYGAYSRREEVFWYLIHELKISQETKLKTNPKLNQAVVLCIQFLKGKLSQVPEHCLGVRP